MIRAIFLMLLVSLNTQAREAYNPLEHMWSGTRDIGNRTSLTVLATGGVLTAGALIFDHSIRDQFHGKDHSFYSLGNKFFGTGIYGVLIGATTLSIGLIADRDHETDAGLAHLEGLAATFAYTTALKFTVARPRPAAAQGKVRNPSFPSGHSSTSFSTAASVLDFYGWKLGAPAIAIAAYTAWGRVASDAHYLSDVIFGSALGFAVGHAYGLHHGSESDAAAGKVSVIPFFETRDEFGLLGKVNF